MYGVALRGLFLFRLADFAMMSSLCFIWKSILQYLQLQPFVFFLIVFHLRLSDVYTDHRAQCGTAAAVVQRNEEKKKKKNDRKKTQCVWHGIV